MNDEVERNVEDYLPLVIKISGLYARRMKEYPTQDSEVYAEGCMALLIAIENYDPSKGASFLTYAWVSIARRCSQYAKRRRSLGSVIGQYALPDDDQGEMELPATETYTPEDLLTIQEVAKIIDEASMTMTARNRELLRRRLAGDTWEQIAEHEGLSKNNIHRRWKRDVVPRLKSCLKEYEYFRGVVR